MSRADYPDRDTGQWRLKFIKKYKKLMQVGRVSVLSVCRFLEHGTRKMAARPFMTQAFETSKDQALDAMTTTLEVGIISSAVQHGLEE
jgi:HK97 gp10 family phage protein